MNSNFHHSNIMNYDDKQSSSVSALMNETTNYDNHTLWMYSASPTEAVLIAFHIGRIISILCIIFGILGNTTLIFTISRSVLCHFPYGLLLLFLSTFDIIRLLSTVLYYLIQANIIPLTLQTSAIYVSLYRYAKIITNWLKVFLAIERLIAVKYWIEHRYNINSKNAQQINYFRQRKFLLLILLLLICSLISQHPNFLSNRFISTYIAPTRLLIINVPSPYFYYGNHVFNGVLFTIISYIILDDLLPIIILIIFNTILLYELRHLPTMTSKKLVESVFILFFLTIFSIFVVPRSFIVLFNLYGNQESINNTIMSVVFHTIQGLEMINHAITGYACFLSCHTLRKDFLRHIRMITKKFQHKNHQLTSAPIELSTISPERL